MSSRPNQGKVEDEILDHLAEARERIADMHPDEGLKHRLNEIEASLGALAVYLDMAFAEMRGEKPDE
jgi:hypothetical protein